MTLNYASRQKQLAHMFFFQEILLHLFSFLPFSKRKIMLFLLEEHKKEKKEINISWKKSMLILMTCQLIFSNLMFTTIMVVNSIIIFPLSVFPNGSNLCYICVLYLNLFIGILMCLNCLIPFSLTNLLCSVSWSSL